MAVAVDVTSKDIQNIVGKFSTTFGGVKKFEVNPLNENLVVGFWGDHFILKIYNSKSDSHEFFLKAFPRNIKKRMEIIQETGFFEREVRIYEHFVPDLQELSSICWAPKIYLAKENHFIVLENLKDYKLYASKILVWDYQHYKIAAKTLAVFHASSVIYEEKFGKISEKELELLDEIAYPEKEGHIRYMSLLNGIKTLMKLIQHIPKYRNSSKLDEILNMMPETIKKIHKFVQTSKKYRNVLLHGDIWTNNVMFKYDENNNPTECKFIDFQFARYAPPAMDLATFFYASSTKEFRRNHLMDILNIYFESFEQEIENHKIPHSALSRDELLKSFNEYRIAGLVESAIFNHVTLLPSDVSGDMMTSSEEYEKFFRQSREEKCERVFEEEDYYRERMTEILTELIDDYILPNL